MLILMVNTSLCMLYLLYLNFSCTLKSINTEILNCTDTGKRTKQLAERSAPNVPPRYGSGKLSFKHTDHKLRYTKFLAKPFVFPYVLDLEALKEQGMEEEMKELLSEKIWKYLLVDFNEPVYPDLVHEFLTTLQVPSSFTSDISNCISFKACGEKFHLNLLDLEEYMGFREFESLSVYDAANREREVPNRQIF